MRSCGCGAYMPAGSELMPIVAGYRLYYVSPTDDALYP